MVADASAGTIAQLIDYDRWGVLHAGSNPGFQRSGFAGSIYDPDTSLVHFGARDYDPSVGRWITKDPILFNSGQANLYVYVNDDPVNFVDYNGLVFGIPAGEDAGTAAAEWWAARSIDPSNSALQSAFYTLGGLFASLWTPETSNQTALTLLNALGYAGGQEIPVGDNWRFAPWGNRTGNPNGEAPHYHRRGDTDPETGQTCPGQGIGRHRPWDSKSPHTSWWDRW